MWYFFYGQHICPVWWTNVSPDDWYSCGYKLSSAICFYMLIKHTSFKGFSRIKVNNIAQAFHSNFRYIDDVLSLNNSWFGDYLQLIYPNEPEVKNTTDTQRFASYLDLHLEMDNRGRLKQNSTTNMMTVDFTFPIVNFPFISSNIPSSPVYGIYISQLKR